MWETRGYSLKIKKRARSQDSVLVSLEDTSFNNTGKVVNPPSVCLPAISAGKREDSEEDMLVHHSEACFPIK